MLYLEFHLNNLSQNPYWNVRPVYLYLVFRIGAHRDNAMTASVFSEDIQEALDSGMYAYISKPVDMAVLQQTICSLLKC